MSEASDSASSLDFTQYEQTESAETTCQSTTSSSSFSNKVSGNETKKVLRSKVLVLIVIAIAAAACGIATFLYTKKSEKELFETQFHDYAIEIVAISHVEAANIFHAISTISATITSNALQFNSQWPNFTLPHFEVHGDHSNEVSKALQISIAPLVKEEFRELWETYSTENQMWIKESLELSTELNLGQSDQQNDLDKELSTIAQNIYRFENVVTGVPVLQSGPGAEFGPGNFAPVWQQAPAPINSSIINFDLLSHPVFRRVYHGLWETQLPVISETMRLDFLYGGAIQDKVENPHSFLLTPIYPFFAKEYHRDDLVGFLVAVLPWDSFFMNLLPDNVQGMVLVVEDTCGDQFTYQIDGREALFLGYGDHHDRQFNYLEITTEFAPFLKHNFSETHEHCEYSLLLYPSVAFENKYTTNNPIYYALVVVMVFAFTAATFVLYDYFVQLRQNKVMAVARRTNAVVASLFPKNVRDKILEDAKEDAEGKGRKGGYLRGAAKRRFLKDFLDENTENKRKELDSKPIADLFPEATVMFADIVGFTAWSSVREPTQVFTLLETIYQGFDDIAKRHRVFKVETVGDCYVAVCGLPDPRKDHAVVMARFARECLVIMNELCKELEVTLGPDTADLKMRVGLHSGQVTAGVLRGEKSRFQLFGDTVNTAARIETTGAPNRIHMSKDTADLLIAAGKVNWIKSRGEMVHAKGKGDIATYWLVEKLRSRRSRQCGDASDSLDCATDKAFDEKWIGAGLMASSSELLNKSGGVLDSKTQRLVEWNADVICRILKQIVSRRNARRALGHSQHSSYKAEDATLAPNSGSIIDEVVEIIELPGFDREAAKTQQDQSEIELDPAVVTQVTEFVSTVASLYHNNPFHNFEHASHVTMSVVKLLSRIVSPDKIPEEEMEDAGEDDIALGLHHHSFGITSDPLTQFACVFAALVHDVDHQGVPNSQLVKEGAYTAKVYQGKSVAEQNSLDISWSLFMDSRFDDLRNTISSSSKCLQRFRQLIINAVMATDIVDKELKNLRNARWENAFNPKSDVANESPRDHVNRKATIVIEHLIQASDVSHTMQHWHIYRKWNERLFAEMYKAYKEGRSDKDPSEFWFRGEIGFFDFYIIPLAKKLKDCGVFGVSSDEYLNYATKNRQEWERCGEEHVATMVEKYRTKYVTLDEDPEATEGGS